MKTKNAAIKKKRSLSQRRAMKGFLFILPWFIGEKYVHDDTVFFLGDDG